MPSFIRQFLDCETQTEAVQKLESRVAVIATSERGE
jgi:hypothetical protein